MIRAVIDAIAALISSAIAVGVIIVLLIVIATVAHADNNPFSGATSISVEMTRDSLTKRPRNITGNITGRRSRPFRLHCTLNGKPMAEWRREKAGQYRVKLDGEWSDVPPDAAGPMMVLLWAGGARCK